MTADNKLRMRNSMLRTAIEYEYTIKRKLNDLINSDETLEYDVSENKEKNRRVHDFYLKKGCKKLNYRCETYIDFKYNLNTGYLTNIIKNTCNNPEKLDNKHQIIIYATSSYHPAVIKKIAGEQIQVISYGEFIEHCEKAISSGKSQKSSGDDANISAITREYDFSKSEEKDLQNDLKSKAKESFKHERVSLFLGAGVSKSARLPDWKELLERVLSKIGYIGENDLTFIDNQCFHSPIITARYIKSIFASIYGFKDSENEQGSAIPSEGNDDSYERKFVEAIQALLYPDGKIPSSELVQTISDISSKGNIESIISYNFDFLIENEFKAKNIPYKPIYAGNEPISKNCIPIVHVHGLVFPKQETHDESNLILCEEEYHKLYQESYNWSTVEQLHALHYNTCFFIGLSMSDPNLRRLLDTAYNLETSSPQHYAFLQNKTSSDLFSNKNRHIVEDMMTHLGVNVIWYDNHEELPRLLREIADIPTTFT